MRIFIRFLFLFFCFTLTVRFDFADEDMTNHKNAVFKNSRCVEDELIAHEKGEQKDKESSDVVDDLLIEQALEQQIKSQKYGCNGEEKDDKVSEKRTPKGLSFLLTCLDIDKNVSIHIRQQNRDKITHKIIISKDRLLCNVYVLSALLLRLVC